ncbi:MAG: alpha/beta hydrolase [Ktedonobacteraceae bacterium]
MPLHPQAQALLAQMKQMGFVYSPELTVDRAREVLRMMIAMRGTPELVAAVEDRLIPGPAGDIPIRIYTQRGSGPFPVLVFFHTGGWQVGNLDSQDPLCRRLTNLVGCIVVSVDYRLAPEHPFPARLEDSYAATQWVASHASEFQGDTARIAVSGDSSGANFAAVIALMARDRGGPKIAFQLMMFPSTDFRLNTPSMEECGEGYNVTRPTMVWIRNNYLPNQEDWTNPLASPFLASDLSGLPPALIITAEYDPLRDEGEAYGERLKEAGVSVKVSRYDGMIHDFPDLFEEPGKQALVEIASALRAAFG